MGAITDFHFEPDDAWEPSPPDREKDRIRQLVQPVYEWVSSMK